MMIRETTHHGQYRKVRDVRANTVEEMTTVLRECPYWYHPDNAERIFALLAVDGYAEHGWTRWEVMP